MATLSNEATEKLAKMIDEEARAWAKEWIAKRQEVMRRRRINASGELIASMQYTATTGLNSAITNTLEVSFKEYGRYVDMKNLNAPEGGGDYIDNLAAWIQRKGLVAKYTNQWLLKNRRKTAPPDILHRMAWAVARSRATNGAKRRPWYTKSKSAAVTDLYNRIAANLPDIVLDELKAAFGRAA